MFAVRKHIDNLITKAERLFKMKPVTTATRVVLWSPHQKVFHIETIGEMLETNLGVYFDQKEYGDFIVLAFTDTADQATDTVDRLRKKLDPRKDEDKGSE